MTLFSYLRTTVLGLLVGAAMASSPSQAQSYNQGDATLYSMTNFGGFSKQVSSATASLSTVSFNNRAASIRTNGSPWLLCHAERFSGPCLVVRQDIPDLSLYGFRGAVASMGPLPQNMNFRHGTVLSRNIIGEYVFYETDAFGNLNFSYNGEQQYRYNGTGEYRQYGDQTNKHDSDGYSGPSRPAIIVYEGVHYSGTALGMNADINALNVVGFDDRISSVEIKRGDWEFCADPYFTGHCKILDRDEIQMSELHLNNNISSIRRVKDGAAQRQREAHAKLLKTADVVVYKDGGFLGDYAIITQDMSHLTDETLNDEISSIRIRRGTWQVCEHPNFSGTCRTLTKSTGKLNIYKLNDNISSIRKIKE